MSLHLAAAQLAATAASVLFTVAAERQRNQLEYSNTQSTRERNRGKKAEKESAKLYGVSPVTPDGDPSLPPQRKKLRGRRRRGRPSLHRGSPPLPPIDQPLSITEDNIPFIKEEIGQMVNTLEIKDELAIKEELLE